MMKKYWKIPKILFRKLMKFIIFIWKVKISKLKSDRKCVWKWKLMKEITAIINTVMTIIRKITFQIIFCG